MFRNSMTVTDRSAGTNRRERKGTRRIIEAARNLDMTAFVERIVQRISEAAPFESAVSHLVAGVLENTAARLSRDEPLLAEEGLPDVEAA